MKNNHIGWSAFEEIGEEISMGCSVTYKKCTECNIKCNHIKNTKAINNFKLICMSIVKEENLIDKNCRIIQVIKAEDEKT